MNPPCNDQGHTHEAEDDKEVCENDGCIHKGEGLSWEEKVCADGKAT